MKLYYIPSAAPPYRWQGTKADANRVGGKGDFQREVPTDKPNLLKFLNEQESAVVNVISTPMGDSFIRNHTPFEDERLFDEQRTTAGLANDMGDEHQLDELEQAEMRAVEAARGVTTLPPPALKQTYEATDIEDFILNRATVDQASNIFACLGTRFKELANGTA